MGFQVPRGLSQKPLLALLTPRSLYFLLVRGGDEEDILLLLRIAGMIVSYNAAKNTFTNLRNLGWYETAGLYYGWPDAYEFIETLARV